LYFLRSLLFFNYSNNHELSLIIEGFLETDWTVEEGI